MTAASLNCPAPHPSITPSPLHRPPPLPFPPGPESCLRYCPDSDAVQLCAHTSYAPGQQVYDSYGPNLSPGELLMDYGFVDEANENHKVEVDPRDVGAWGRGQAGLEDTAGEQRWFRNAHLRRSAQYISQEHTLPACCARRLCLRSACDAHPPVPPATPVLPSSHQPLPTPLPCALLRCAASPSSSRARALLGALSVVQGESVRMALTPRGPDLAFLTWLRAAVGTDAELIRAGEAVCWGLSGKG